MQGIILNDWTQYNHAKKEHRKKLLGALQYFCSLPDLFTPKILQGNKTYQLTKQVIRTGLAKLQEVGLPSDFPATQAIAIWEKFHLTTHYDNAYEQIFDVRNFEGTKQSGFDISNVESGLTFEKIPLGDKIKTFGMSGTKVRTLFDYYGAGLMWHRQLFDDEEYWTLEDNAIEFRNKAFAKRAQDNYTLIDAVAAGQNIAWTAPVPATLPNTDATYAANRDAQTINAAIVNIINNTLNKGYGINTQTTNFVILVPHALATRIKMAIGLVLQGFAQSPGHMNYNVTMMTTTMLTSATSYYVILPKLKAKAGYRMNLTIFSDFDITNYSDVSAGWLRYGASIGDQEQFQRCATA